MKNSKCAEQEQCIQILKDHDAKIVRTKKHIVWKLPDGRTWTMPSTPSDPCAWKNNLSDLRLFLGLNAERGKPGERRPKKPRAQRKKPETAVALAEVQEPAHGLREQLAAVRITEVTASVPAPGYDLGSLDSKPAECFCQETVAIPEIPTAVSDVSPEPKTDGWLRSLWRWMWA